MGEWVSALKQSTVTCPLRSGGGQSPSSRRVSLWHHPAVAYVLTIAPPAQPTPPRPTPPLPSLICLPQVPEGLRRARSAAQDALGQFVFTDPNEPPPHALVSTALIQVLMLSINSLEVYVAGAAGDHRHMWADMLCYLLQSFIDASNAVVQFAKHWDGDYATEPPDVSVKDAVAALEEFAVNFTPLVSSCEAAVEDPGGVGPMDEGDRTQLQQNEHPGQFVYPYLSLLDVSSRSVGNHISRHSGRLSS